MFEFSKHGIKNKDEFSEKYSDFIEWCKSKVSASTFSTYYNGEPFFFNSFVELSYSRFLQSH